MPDENKPALTSEARVALLTMRKPLSDGEAPPTPAELGEARNRRMYLRSNPEAEDVTDDERAAFPQWFRSGGKDRQIKPAGKSKGQVAKSKATVWAEPKAPEDTEAPDEA